MGWGQAALHVAAILFGGDPGDTVEFPDGTTVTDPMTDSQGQIYKYPSDYYEGNDPYKPDGKGGAYPSR